MGIDSMAGAELCELAQMYAFLGNTLLRPMNQTKSPGLNPEFWAALPDFDNEAVGFALDDLCDFAAVSQARQAAGTDMATEVSYEYTKLFVGPPSPAAAPWETYYPVMVEGEETPEPTCGFGEPTFRMRALLREAGLELANENHQFEDHIGIELLYLSMLIARGAEGEESALGQAASFIVAHPARWIDRLASKVESVFPQGYFIGLLRLAKALMGL